MLDNEEIRAIEELLSTTNLLQEITNNLSGENYTTMSSVLPLLRKIRQCLKVEENDSNLQRQIKVEILSPFHRYDNNELMILLRLSTFSDPRFRLRYVEDAEETKKIALEKMISLHTELPTVSSCERIIPQPKKGLEKLLEDDEETESIDDFLPRNKAEKELKNYLSMPKIGLNENPLTWWKLNEHNFPIIKALAKKYLAIQGSSVPSERIFSTGGNVITKHRASLLPKNAEMLVFLFQNKNLI
ncbi:E3 SUMO-protein ligase ZBED1-like [Parasteatoda tepidariorum]|uniref:E3 SUMO-protein ligase ZBED1-like n=1 Tax=Parasteatoda tepidariorum TaxID=114398 RepID=UPI000A2C00DB|nr:E3 SUMO-protein ligase ZBED1-like [Parasteatoda tepidariorum]